MVFLGYFSLRLLMGCDPLVLGGSSCHRSFTTYRVVWVELQIFIRVSGLSVDSGVEGPIVACVYFRAVKKCDRAVHLFFTVNWMCLFIMLRWWWNSAECSEGRQALLNVFKPALQVMLICFWIENRRLQILYIFYIFVISFCFIDIVIIIIILYLVIFYPYHYYSVCFWLLLLLFLL